MTDDDRRNRHPAGRKVERLLPFRRVEEALGEADPAGAEPRGARSEHQILRSQRAILDDPWAMRLC